MYSGSPYSGNTSQDYGRTSFSQSHSQPFTVAGMPSSAAAHSPNLRASSLTGPVGLGDSLGGSRGHYHPGYLMSAAPSTSPRVDDVPIVPTKAKISHVLSEGSGAEFGRDSMFQSSRQRTRTVVADADAPPTTSVNDIVNEVYEPNTRRGPQNFNIDSPARSTMFRQSVPATPKPPSNFDAHAKPLYVIVYGYPLDKYSITADYFRSLGNTTEPEQNPEIMNCFRIGFTNPVEAVRAIRKNGEVLAGAWMVGVKWADPIYAETLLGSSLARDMHPMSPPEPSNMPDVPMAESVSSRAMPSPEAQQLALAVRNSSPYGTPVKLAPSTSAYRKPEPHKGPLAPFGQPGAAPSQPGQPGVQPSPSKGVLGQVTDLIFGW